LLTFWREARGGSKLPNISHMSGSNLRRWVGDVSIMHLHKGSKRFFVSLHGENVCRHIGPHFNKKYLEDVIPSSSLDLALAPYEESIKRGAPTYAVMLPTVKNGLHSPLERFVLPFCGDKPDKVERFLVWVAPNDGASDRTKSIYDDTIFTECCDSFFSLYGFKGDEPHEITWKRHAMRSDAQPGKGPLQKIASVFARPKGYGFR